MKSILTVFLQGIFIFSSISSIAQDKYKSVSRYDYYTNEQEVEVVVWVPASKEALAVTIDIVFEFDHLQKGEAVSAGQMNVFSFPMERLHQGINEITVSYNEDGKWVGSDKLEVILLEHQYNAVKIDRVSGGLIVEDLPFYPFGFYNYSPVQPGLAEEELVKGFNMMSPYQKIEGKSLKERKAYMDRCAALGMKVNYNVLSLAGGGGVAIKGNDKHSHKQRIKLLQKEIETFRDHPALLSWYISDEPIGQGVPPDSLIEAYKLIKELDPYHPVTVVFMSPWMAKDYSDVMDIVMADPYPIPHGKVEEVGAIAAMLKGGFFLDKPVWIVPQAFGGNEWWEREPTRQELRAMTYLSLVNNAMGIQYFIRHGLNSFPKSTTAWNECGTIALEVAELTPYLFSPDPVAVSCIETDVQLKGYHIDGTFVILAVNTSNQPLQYSFSIDEFGYSGSAAVMFEDRKVAVKKGKIDDIIDAYGTRVYKIRYKMFVIKGPKVHNKNMIKDPSFENIAGLGIPASCYAKANNGRGATYFTDSRIAVAGEHSVRMTSPGYEEGMSLSFYRTRIKPGQSYTMSIQAKAIPLKYREKVEPKFFKRLCGCGPDEEDFPEFSMSMGADCEEYFIPDGEWREYSFSCIPEPAFGSSRMSPVLRLIGQGTAWFDLVQLYPDMEIKSFVSRDKNEISIRLFTVHKGAEIFYSIDGSEPTMNSSTTKGNIRINASSTIKASAYKDGKRVGYIERPFIVSYATGRYVDYKYKYSKKYDAGYKDGLVDGILASNDFEDGNWQGFEGDKLDVLINLKEIKTVSEIELHFLRNHASWIFLPKEIKILWSADGNDYHEFTDSSNEEGIPQDANIYTYRFNVNVEARYIRIIAENIGTCPEGHTGAGSKAWLFTDEIIIH